jgi:hypothetical protein
LSAFSALGLIALNMTPPVYTMLVAVVRQQCAKLVLMSKHSSSTTFYCFSPPVMVATCVIEFSLFIYTLMRYKMSTVTRLACAMLLLLGVFQLSEFNVCGLSGTGSAAIWSRVGYVAITLLPPLGMHLIRVISGRGSKATVALAYASGLAFALVFGFSASAFQSHVCGGNYAIFQLQPPLGGLYFTYYYGWLIAGIFQSMYFSVQASKKVREALVMQAFGYLSFLLPTGIVNTINPQTIAGIPSIMCGFAVIYALILSFGIVPRVLAKRR